MTDEPKQIGDLRRRTTLVLILCYLVPLLLITLYNVSILPLSQGWAILSAGILAATAGGSILFILLRRWEAQLVQQAVMDVASEHVILERLPEPCAESEEIAQALNVSQEDLQRLADLLTSSQKQCELLSEELHREQRSLEGINHDRERLEHMLKQAQQALDSQNVTYEERLQAKETMQQEYQQTIADQRLVIEKRQQAIATLETEVRDLKYELKTLLALSDGDEQPVIEEQPTRPTKIAEAPTKTASKTRAERSETSATTLDLGFTIPSRSSEEAQQQLKRCIDIAQKLTGARHLAGDSSRFRDLSADGYALDLRRLCDSLLSEQTSMILLYSQRENKALFVNNQVRGMLGWSPEKFLQGFPGIISDGEGDWRAALQSVATNQRAEACIKIKTRAGEDYPVRCLLGSVPTGIFKTHVIIVMYSAAS